MESQKQQSQRDGSSPKIARSKLIGRYILGLLGGFVVIIMVVFGKRLLSSISFSQQAKVPTPTNLVFQASRPLQLNLPPLITPTMFVVQPTSTPEAPPVLLVSGLDYYRDPEGLFEIVPDAVLPADLNYLVVDQQRISTWFVAEESADSLVLVDSKKLITFTVQAINTGYEIDHTSLMRFIDAREQKSGNRYTVDEKSDQKENTGKNSITVTKSYPMDPSTIIGVTAYQQYSNMIAVTDLVFSKDYYSSYPHWIDQIFNAVKFHPENTVSKPAYAQISEVIDPHKQIRIKVPDGWINEVVSGEFTWVASYYSPDLHAVIQLLTYDDGELLSDAVAGNFALFLLNSYLSTNIMVTVDHMLPSGIEQLEWHSPRYNFNYIGTSSFHSFGTTFVMLTVMYDIDYADFYLPVLERSQENFNLSIQATGSEE
jgi:hypothetical protein